MSDIPTITPDDDYSEVKECDYKDEHYSVRNNGAIMRHARSTTISIIGTWVQLFNCLGFSFSFLFPIMAWYFFDHFPSKKYQASLCIFLFVISKKP